MYRGKTIALTSMALNEERLIRPTLESVPDFVDRVYFVDDGSTDKTLAIAREIARLDPRIRVIQHDRDLGVGQSIITDYEHSTADNNDITVVVAGDNQMLQRRGLLDDSQVDELTEAEPLQAALAAASVQGQLATGERAGQRVRRLLSDAAEAVRSAPLCFAARGFSLHSASRIAADDRAGLERLIRYATRPPLVAGRLPQRRRLAG